MSSNEINNERIAILEEEIKAQSEFASMIAHQLKTPLTGTKWAYKMLLDCEFGPITLEQKKVLNEGYKNNERMIALIDEMRQANKTRTWCFHYNMASVDVEELIKEVMTELIPVSKNKMLPILLRTNGTPCKINADVAKLRIVIENLIDNAIKYSPEDRNNEISISISYDDKQTTISVHNAGTTTTAEENNLVFKKSIRGKQAKESPVGGTGFGLFTAHRIINDHHGIIKFESSEKDGTTVTIIFPFA